MLVAIIKEVESLKKEIEKAESLEKEIGKGVA